MAPTTTCELQELLKDPHGLLTAEQWNNFDDYMLPSNDDKSAKDVDISAAVESVIDEINKRDTYWW